MSLKRSRNTSYYIKWSVVLALFTLALVTAGLLIIHRQYILDSISAAQYQPSDEMASIVSKTTMTDEGKRYFYATHPTLDDAAAFNEKCQKKEEKSAILGCYTGASIHIYRVTDERLAGVEEVTSAHEMLHVAYDRLSDGERKWLKDLLENEYDKQHDQLQERMEYYDRTEPGQRYNELHSIIATEMKNVSPELEQYYARYFSDRSKVIALYDSYKTKFDSISDKTANLKRELEHLSDDINKSTQTYTAQSKALNADIGEFNRRAQEGDFSGDAAFNQERAVIVARVEAMNKSRTAINKMVSEYEKKRKAYNALVDESNSLQKSIDSSLAPPPSL